LRCIVLIVLVVAIAGCVAVEPFQPPPDVYQRWEKPGEPEVGVKKALLECGGYPSPYDIGDMAINDIVLADLCMVESGYAYNRKDKYRYCLGSGVALLACSPDAKAPKRDVKKRLESRFCRDYPQAEVCQR